MANQENKGKAETFILRGNAESVMRQLVDEYNSSNGWSVNRIVNNILNFTVVLERNTEQGVSKDTSKEPEKATSAKVAKAVEATDNTQEIAESDSVQVATDVSEDAVESVKVNVKATRKAKPQS